MLFAALTPLLAVFGLLVVLRLPAALAMPLSLVLTAGVSIAVWKVETSDNQDFRAVESV